MASHAARRRVGVLAATVLPVILVAACAGQGASSATPPVATSWMSGSPVPSLTPVPGSIAPTASAPSGSDDPSQPFEPPAPACPAPPVAIEVPRILASAGGRTVRMNAGSSTVTTCSTASSTDVIPVDPTDPLHVAAGEPIHVALPAGWHFLYWERWDRAPGTEGTNVTPGGRTPDRPTSIDVPAPARTGPSILGVSAWVITTDGRAVSGIEGTVLVEP